jgi:16S rRNA (adenine1518-N6/adenine1519-N6)-dimethyltransferase
MSNRGKIPEHLFKDLRPPVFVPKKQLGQIFLADPNITHKIIAACQFQADETVVEIGPGEGVLTKEIAPRVRRLIAIETDRRLCERLHAQLPADRLEIIHADFLKFDMNSLPSPVKIVGNLPYYISTPIISKILLHHRQVKEFYGMLQLEYGRRLAAQPGSKDYGSFSCFAQYYADVKMLFTIKNTCFRPVPKVHSCFLRFGIREDPVLKAKDETMLFNLIRCGFQQRRKTILNALSAPYKKEVLLAVFQTLDINPKARAESLHLEDFIKIADALSENK